MNINVERTKEDKKSFEVSASVSIDTIITNKQFTDIHLHAERAGVFRDIKNYDTYALSRTDDDAIWNVAVSYPVTSPVSWIPWKTIMHVKKQIDEKNGVVHFRGSSNCVTVSGKWFVKDGATVHIHQTLVFRLPIYVPLYMLKNVVTDQTRRAMEDIRTYCCRDYSDE